MKNLFENYLMEIHARDYIGTDDDMPDNYEYWLDNVDKNELIEYANKALSQQKQEIIEQAKKCVPEEMKIPEVQIGEDKYDLGIRHGHNEARFQTLNNLENLEKELTN
jgi:hypothetical protein